MYAFWKILCALFSFLSVLRFDFFPIINCFHVFLSSLFHEENGGHT